MTKWLDVTSPVTFWFSNFLRAYGEMSNPSAQVMNDRLRSWTVNESSDLSLTTESRTSARCPFGLLRERHIAPRRRRRTVVGTAKE